AVPYGVDQQFAQRAPAELQPAQHVEHLPAQRRAGLLKLIQELAVDVPLAGLLGEQVPEMADLGLAYAVDSAKALLQAVWVPWQIVVHHQVGALEIDAFARRIGGQ